MKKKKQKNNDHHQLRSSSAYMAPIQMTSAQWYSRRYVYQYNYYSEIEIFYTIK